MSVQGTITDLRYLKRSDLDPEQQILKNYFRETIHSYGVDSVYYRHDANLFEEPSGIAVNYAYGEKTTMTYWLSAPLIIYSDMKGDNIILSKFGAETNGDITCYILIDDFTEQFRDLIGTPGYGEFISTVSAEVSAYSGILQGNIINSDISGYTSAQLTFATSGSVYGEQTGSFIRYPKKYIDYIYKCDSYTDQIVNGTLSGSYSGTLDVSGYGSISGSLSGALWYYTVDPGKNAGPNWKISPQVGDFFRLDFDENNHEEYEITRIYDRNLMLDGLNQLLFRYVWKCDAVRRDPSYEPILSQDIGAEKEEEFTTDKKKISDLLEIASDKIFDYERKVIDSHDGVKHDAVYGEYTDKSVYDQFNDFNRHLSG